MEVSRQLDPCVLLEHATRAQVAARRSSCMDTCLTLHRSYVTSVCDRYSEIVDDEKPERATCVGMSLTLARQCRVIRRHAARQWA